MRVAPIFLVAIFKFGVTADYRDVFGGRPCEFKLEALRGAIAIYPGLFRRSRVNPVRGVRFPDSILFDIEVGKGRVESAIEEPEAEAALVLTAGARVGRNKVIRSGYAQDLLFGIAVIERDLRGKFVNDTARS